MTKHNVLASCLIISSGALAGSAQAQLAVGATQGQNSSHLGFADQKQEPYQRSFVELEARLEHMIENETKRTMTENQVVEWCEQLGFSKEATNRVLQQTMSRLGDFREVMADPLNPKWIPAEREQPAYRTESPVESRSFVRVRPWPDARIPYRFANTIVDAIEDGCDEMDDDNCVRASDVPANFFAVTLAIQEFTPVRFVGYDPVLFDDVGFITIETNGPDGEIGIALDAEFDDGFIEVETVINSSSWFDFHSSTELLAHVIGLRNEIQRKDRNNFVTVNFENIAPAADGFPGGTTLASASEYQLLILAGTLLGGYDLGSITHFSDDDGSIIPGSLPTFTVKAPNQAFQDLAGEMPFLSDNDIAAINAIYSNTGFVWNPLALCPADVNRNGIVDFNDFNLFVQLLISRNIFADLNSDGEWNSLDLLTFLTEFRPGFCNPDDPINPTGRPTLPVFGAG